jgi:hypothetical protein
MKRSVIGAFGVVLLGLTMPTLAADVNGTWKWTTERNGTKVESTLKLKQDGEKLTGTITRNDMATDIADGKVAGDDVSFTVTREFNGTKVVMKYEGKVSGDTIKGKIESERDGQKTSRDWEAKKS